MKTSKKKQPVMARKGRVLLPPYTSIGTDFVSVMWTLPTTQEALLQMHRQIKVAIDQEDGTGNGFDHCAWAVMRSIGITDLAWKQFWKLLEAEHRRITPPTK